MSQRPLEELERGGYQFDSWPDRAWDVVVIGAGPAGSTAALNLAEAGHRVLLLDRHRFPRDKTCGEAILPDALAALDRAGLGETVRRLGHQTDLASVYSPTGRELRIPGTYLTLRRRWLDALLARRAVERGAFFGQGGVSELRVGPDGAMALTLAGDRHRTIRAGLAVVATGARVGLLRGIGSSSPRGPDALALRGYVRSSFRIDKMVAAYERSTIPGYGWIFPLGKDEYNVGCIVFRRNKRMRAVNLREMWSCFVSEFPLARDLLGHGERISPLRGAMLRCGLRGGGALAGRGVVAVGDAVGAIYPLTGEGIGKAMETGELAAGAIDAALATGDQGRLADYPVRLERDLGPKYRSYQWAENLLARTGLPDFLARRGARSRYLSRAAADVLAERLDPRRAFGLGRIFTWLWRGPGAA